MFIRLSLFGGILFLAAPVLLSQTTSELNPGHSLHGEAFNEGPRQKAYLMPGMSNARFEASSTNDLALKFFDQGVGQLHGFWYFESERSFRQAATLDTNFAVAYWGMAMSNQNNQKRARGFMDKAVSAKSKASPREKLWIEAYDAYFKDSPDKKTRRRNLMRALENIIHEHPGDIEAKAFLVYHIWESAGDWPIASRESVDALARQVLEINPMHPLHHYRIHLWNSEKDSRAVDSAIRCGQSAPGIAHMWHMSGHTFSKLHRYEDAAWQQEASARVDHAHQMRDRVLPDQIHNFAHNNSWLIDDLSHLGQVKRALDLAKNMIELPRLMRTNSGPNRATIPYTYNGSSWSLGRNQLFTLLMRYEMWDDLVALAQTVYLEPTELIDEQANQARALGVAYFMTGKFQEGAEQLKKLETLVKEIREERHEAVDAAEEHAHEEKKNTEQVNRAMTDALTGFNSRFQRVQSMIAELKAYKALLEEDTYTMKDQLASAKEMPKERQSQFQVKVGDLKKAEELAREAVKSSTNQVQPLANLIDILHLQGKTNEAREAFEKLTPISRTIDLDIPVFKRLSPVAKMMNLSPDWRTTQASTNEVGDRPPLDNLGPFRWRPSSAPEWTLANSDGKRVSLQQFRGKPIILIFYLGNGCIHCLEQLNLFAPMAREFAEAGVTVLGVSTDTVDGLRKTLDKSGEPFPFQLLADPYLEVFKAYRAFDDFENLPLHGTFLVDGRGALRWQDISFEPFTQPKFLLIEAKRLLSFPNLEMVQQNGKPRKNRAAKRNGK